MDQSERSVLVVSSDLETLRALSHGLTLGGYAVTTATDWSEALAMPSWSPVSVMLYDVKDLGHRERDRLVALRKLRPDLSVVLLSSLESRALDRGIAEGLIAGYQVKPISLTSLEEWLESLQAEGQRANG